MHTVRIATNPRKWRRPAPCPACRKSQPLILRRRANIEHISLGEQRIDTATRDAR